MNFFSADRALFALAIGLAISNSSAGQDKPTGAATLSPDLTMVPKDAKLLVAFNLSNYWDGPEADDLKRIASAHPVVPTWWFKEISRTVGVQPENIARAIYFSADIESIGVITTKEPYDPNKVKTALTPEAKKKSAAGKDYFYSDKSKNAVYFVDSRTFLVDVGHDMAGFLSHEVVRGSRPPINRVLVACQQGSPIVIHAGPEFIRSVAADQKMLQSPLAPLVPARAWQIITNADKQLTVDLIADFATSEEASRSPSALATIGEKLGELAPFYKSHMGPFLEEQSVQYPGAKALIPELTRVLDATAEGLKTMRTNSDKGSAIARIEIKTDKPLTTTVMLLTLLPRPEKSEKEKR